MTDTFKRPPPGYLVYASDSLASSSFFGLSAGERGLLSSMQMAYWCEGGRGIPRNPILLSRTVRLDTAEVERFLTPQVLLHFETDSVDPDTLHCTELQRQLNNVRIAREKMADGGRKGAATTNNQRDGRRKPRRSKPLQQPAGHPASNHAGDPASHPAGSSRGPELSRDELSRDEKSSSSLGKKPNTDPWVVAYSETKVVEHDPEAAIERAALQSRETH